MIRVLHVVTHMNRGGLETMIMNYYRHIDRSRVQFDFLTHRPYDGEYGGEIKALGGHIYHLPKLNPVSPSYLKKLDSFFKKHKEYRIIHVHQDCMSGVILKVALKNNVPVRIAHCHSASQDKNIKYPVKWIYKRNIGKYATNLLACGEKAGKWMFNGAPFEIINNAIDAGKYRYNEDIRKEQRRIWNIPEDEIVIGHVGRFSYPKNHDFLIDVFSEILKKKDVRFMLVGDGSLKGKIEEKVKKLGIEDKVVFTGLRSDVPDILQAFDIFVFPSIYEGFPVALLEAQASGLQCFTSDRVSQECTVTDLVKVVSLEDGPKAWADAIVKDIKKENRIDTYCIIKNAGYDIVENSKELMERYEAMIR